MSQCDDDVRDDEYINTLEKLTQKQDQLIERLYTLVGERENEIEWCRRELTKLHRRAFPNGTPKLPDWRKAYIGNRLVDAVETKVNKLSGKTGVG